MTRDGGRCGPVGCACSSRASGSGWSPGRWSCSPSPRPGRSWSRARSSCARSTTASTRSSSRRSASSPRLQQEIDPATGGPLDRTGTPDPRHPARAQRPRAGEAFVTFVNGAPLPAQRARSSRTGSTPTPRSRASGARRPPRSRQRRHPGRRRRVPGGAASAPGRDEWRVRRRDLPRFETDDIGTSPRALAGVGVVVFALGTLLTWRTAERVVAPVQAVTRTAHQIRRRISARRIPATGDDEIAELAETFNEMLDRLESAFAHPAALPGRRRSRAAHADHDRARSSGADRRRAGGTARDGRAGAWTSSTGCPGWSTTCCCWPRWSGPDFLRLETVEVGALTREMHAKAAALAPRDGSSPWRDTASSSPIASGSRRPSSQLAQNAVQHTAEGRRDRASGRSVTDGVARFSVRDSGPGVRRHERERIFERFARGPGCRARAPGSGLTIVRAIAEAHGGRAELESPPGGGAEFVIEDSRRSTGRRADRSRDRGRGMSSILIVEDEARIASFVEKGLRANGFATTVAADGRAPRHGAGGARLRPGDPRPRPARPRRPRGAATLRSAGATLPVVILTARDGGRRHRRRTRGRRRRLRHEALPLRGAARAGPGAAARGGRPRSSPCSARARRRSTCARAGPTSATAASS